jgi:RNA polymerase sigma-70 factor (ECF subfamily)
MKESGSTTTVRLQQCLQRLAIHDATARSELLEHAARRLAVLAKRMFARVAALRHREDSEDAFQQAMLRLWESLEQADPGTVAEFMGLAAREMRGALCDLARGHAEMQRRALHSEADLAAIRDHRLVLSSQLADSTWAPDDLACWSEFHAAADRLREPERTAFDLLYYHAISQSEVAELMQVSERQVRRYWQSAREKLARTLEEWLPGA